MTISGFTPTLPLPGLAPSGVTLAGSNPLLAGSVEGQVPTGAQLAAMSGVGEQPGIGTRLVSAMKAAIGELRGSGASDAQINNQILAMQAQAPVTLAKPAAATPRPAAADASDQRIVRAKTWKTLAPKAPVTPKVPAPVLAVPAALPAAPAPTNATQLPGATVYSYDQHGNPALAGLQGLAPTMQQQLGMSPTMLQGVNGLAQAADPDGPQVNATNQTLLNGTGSGTGAGIPFAGSAVPVLGAPIIVAPPAAAVAPAPPTPVAAGSAGANQQVTNRNATDVGSLNQGVGGYGSGYGASPWDPSGGIATPYSPYGSSMTGSSAFGGQKQGFFSRLFG